MAARGWPRILIAVAAILLTAAPILLAAALSAQAQSGAPPGNAAAAALKPLHPPAQATPAGQLPLDKLKLPPGFHIEVYAAGIAKARSLRVGKRGAVFVGSSGDKVSAIVEADGKRAVKVIASGLTRPNGLAYRDGTLYIAEPSQISKIDNVEDALDNPPKPAVIYSDLPKDEPNSARAIAVGPDGKLYVSVGMACNNCVPPAGQGQIRRIDLAGGNVEAVALGVRNSLGFDWSPRNKTLYFTDNGRDWLSEDAPSDELNRVTKPGEDFGAPYCYQGNLTDPQLGWGRSCDDFTPPIALLGPHVAPLGMRFYTGRMFPERYRNAIFIARHGSWNRTKKLGGDVVVLHLNKEGTVQSMEPFLTGFLDNNNFLGRPVDVQPMRDGSLLISDDWNGAVYRVSYGSGREQRNEPRERRRRRYRRDFFFND
jgi:glucose/arabinose dehydrogenase